MTQQENNTYAWLDAQPAIPRTDASNEKKQLQKMLDFIDKF